MKIKKINTNEELDVTVKEVRLPSLNERVENLDECDYIISNSYSYCNGRLYYAIFKDFIRDEDNFEMDEESSPLYGNEYDTGGYIDLIPVIEVEEELEQSTVYLANNIPFVAASKNKLICLTRTCYYMAGENCCMDYSMACNFLDRELDYIKNWR